MSTKKDSQELDVGRFLELTELIIADAIDHGDGFWDAVERLSPDRKQEILDYIPSDVDSSQPASEYLATWADALHRHLRKQRMVFIRPDFDRLFNAAVRMITNGDPHYDFVNPHEIKYYAISKEDFEEMTAAVVAASTGVDKR